VREASTRELVLRAWEELGLKIDESPGCAKRELIFAARRTRSIFAGSGR